MEINSEYSLEGLMLRLKLQYFGHLMRRADSFEKTLIWGKIEVGRRGWQRMRWLDSITDSMDNPHILYCHLLLLQSFFFSIRVFSNESALRIRWPKYWNFSLSISPSNEYSGFFSFRIDWFDLLADQGTLKSLIQHHISKMSVLQCSTFFIVQLSHPYMTTWKTIALTIWTFAGKVISLLFKTLFRFDIAVLPRSNHFLISWLWSPSAVILEPKKMKSDTVSTFSPSICHEVIGWTPRVDDRQGGLACCGSWGCKESDITEWLNWTELNWTELNW